MITLGKWLNKELASTNRAIEKAEMYAINRATRTAVIRTVAFVRERYNIKKSELMDAVRITKASKGKPYSTVTIRQIAIPLIRRNAKQFGESGWPARKRRKRRTAGGVKATEIKGQRKLYKGAFIQTMKTGHRGVFIRKTDEPNPIKELFAPSARDLLANDTAQKEMEKIFYERIEIEFDQQLNFQLSKK